MKTIITAGKGGKPVFDPGGLNSLSKLSRILEAITDTAGITWTGPVINGRLDLECAHYLDRAQALARIRNLARGH